MDFRFTEEQESWHRMLNRITDREGGAEYTRKCDMEQRFPQEWWDKGVANGWLGLLVPKKYGGTDIDTIRFVIFCETISKYSFEMGNLFFGAIHNSKNIVHFGTEDQKQRYLPAFVKGEITFSGSITEPDAGSDATSLSTSAVLEGDYFIVNGTKMFSTGASIPHNIIMLACRTNSSAPKKNEGISVLMVPNDLPGIEIHELNLIVEKSVKTCEVSFSDVKVPRENLLGELNKGWIQLGSQLSLERVAVSASHVGESQTALNDAIKYAMQREQFGQSIVKFQSIRHMIADLQTELDAARLLVYRVVSLIEAGIPCAKEAAMAKLYSSEVFSRITNAGMQILGGYSMDPLMDMERHWRYAKVSTIGGGTSQIQRSIIAREMGI